MLRFKYWVFCILLVACLLLQGVANANQARSLVGRAHSDMRSLATAIESYRLDHGAYPPAEAGERLSFRLTTPVAYISSLPSDPTKTHRTIRERSYLGYVFSIPIPLAPSLPYWTVIVFTGLIAVFLSTRTWILKRSGKTEVWVLPGMAVFLLAIFAPWLVQCTHNWLRFDSFSMNYYEEVPRHAPDGSYTGYHYQTNGVDWWVLQGNGFDGQRTLELLSSIAAEDWFERDYYDLPQAILNYTYDPTNGISSSGDIFRVGP